MAAIRLRPNRLVKILLTTIITNLTINSIRCNQDSHPRPATAMVAIHEYK